MSASEQTLNLLEQQLRKLQHVRIVGNRIIAYEQGRLQPQLSAPASSRRPVMVVLGVALVGSAGWLIYTAIAAARGLEPLPITRPVLLVALMALVAVLAHDLVMAVSLRRVATVQDIDRTVAEIVDRHAGQFSTAVDAAHEEQSTHVAKSLGQVRSETARLHNQMGQLHNKMGQEHSQVVYELEGRVAAAEACVLEAIGRLEQRVVALQGKLDSGDGGLDPEAIAAAKRLLHKFSDG